MAKEAALLARLARSKDRAHALRQEARALRRDMRRMAADLRERDNKYVELLQEVRALRDELQGAELASISQIIQGANYRPDRIKRPRHTEKSH